MNAEKLSVFKNEEMKRNTCMIFLFCFLSSLSPLALCDTIYLENSANLEGIVEKEDKNSVVLNIGYGKITLEKKDIKYIHRGTPLEQNNLIERWRYKYFTRPEFIPVDLKDIASDFNNLGGIRQEAIVSKKERDIIVKQAEELEKELEELNAGLALVSEKLSAAKAENTLGQYNALVNEFNSFAAKIKSAEYKKSSFQKELITLDKKISGYVNDFRLFRKRFMERYVATDQKNKEQNEPFFEGVKKELSLMENDFTKHAIDFNEYATAIVVDALLNGIVKANLIVDTGASVIVISKEIADKLGLKFTDKESAIVLVTLADGNKVKAYPAILETVKVGDVEVKNVKAAVLQHNMATEEDGLLGMSFLGHFVIKIDAKSNKLVLEEFSP